LQNPALKSVTLAKILRCFGHKSHLIVEFPREVLYSGKSDIHDRLPSYASMWYVFASLFCAEYMWSVEPYGVAGRVGDIPTVGSSSRLPQIHVNTAAKLIVTTLSIDGRCVIALVMNATTIVSFICILLQADE
jgi:hypothetical protein